MSSRTYKFLKGQRNVLAFGLFLILVFIVAKRNQLFRDGRCDSKMEFQNTILNGIVVEKYIDSTQHSYPIIVVKNKDTTLQTLNLVFDTSGLFSSLSIGDSLLKQRNNLELIVKKPHETINKTLDYGCNN